MTRKRTLNWQLGRGFRLFLYFLLLFLAFGFVARLVFFIICLRLLGRVLLTFV